MEDAPAVWPTWTAAQAAVQETNSSSGGSPSESDDDDVMAWVSASVADEPDLEAFGGNGTQESLSAAGGSTSAPAVGAGQHLVTVPPGVNGGMRVQVARTDGSGSDWFLVPQGARAGMQFVAAPMARERGGVPDGLRPARDPAADPAVASPPQQPPAVQPPPTGQPRRRPGGLLCLR